MLQGLKDHKFTRGTFNGWLYFRLCPVLSFEFDVGLVGLVSKCSVLNFDVGECSVTQSEV